MDGSRRDGVVCEDQCKDFIIIYTNIFYVTEILMIKIVCLLFFSMFRFNKH